MLRLTVQRPPLPPIYRPVLRPRIPSVYLRSLHNDLGPDVPETPVIAFINSRSGGRQGEQLALALSRALGRSQVFDLSSHTPSAVLSGLWAALDARERCGDAEAAHIRRTLRIVAAGGDGTIAWVLNSISQLGLDPAPPVAILPLGTGGHMTLCPGLGGGGGGLWVAGGDGQ